ncbi:hypothetical protein [Chryseobacterium sp. GVT01B]|uniref:hypothetical protein n=1 Tax=Chryseobacterium sp. GVT01B TaxID=2862675 RepID=UPI001CBF1EF5|nr:hypothetical protein [Chryseobacterium sp. GVT01B]
MLPPILYLFQKTSTGKYLTFEYLSTTATAAALGKLLHHGSPAFLKIPSTPERVQQIRRSIALLPGGDSNVCASENSGIPGAKRCPANENLSD